MSTPRKKQGKQGVLLTPELAGVLSKSLQEMAGAVAKSTKGPKMGYGYPAIGGAPVMIADPGAAAAEFAKSMDAINTKMAALAFNFGSCQRELEDVRQKYKEYHDAKGTLDDRAKEAEEQLNECRVLLEDHNAQLGAAVKEKELATKKIASLEEELTKYKMEIAALRATVASAEQMLKDERLLREAIIDKMSTTQGATGVESAVQEQLKIIEVQKRTAENKLGEAMSKVSALEAQIKSANEGRQLEAAKSAELAQELAEVKGKLETAKKDILAKDREISARGGVHQEMEDEILELRQKIAEKEEEKERILRDYRVDHDSLVKTAKELEELQKHARSVQDQGPRIKGLEALVKEHEEEINGLKALGDRYGGEVDQRSEEIEGLKGELEELNQKHTASEKEIANMRKELEEKNKKISSLERKIAATEGAAKPGSSKTSPEPVESTTASQKPPTENPVATTQKPATIQQTAVAVKEYIPTASELSAVSGYIQDMSKDLDGIRDWWNSVVSFDYGDKKTSGANVVVSYVYWYTGIPEGVQRLSAANPKSPHKWLVEKAAEARKSNDVIKWVFGSAIYFIVGRIAWAIMGKLLYTKKEGGTVQISNYTRLQTWATDFGGKANIDGTDQLSYKINSGEPNDFYSIEGNKLKIKVPILTDLLHILKSSGAAEFKAFSGLEDILSKNEEQLNAKVEGAARETLWPTESVNLREDVIPAYLRQEFKDFAKGNGQMIKLSTKPVALVGAQPFIEDYDLLDLPDTDADVEEMASQMVNPKTVAEQWNDKLYELRLITNKPKEALVIMKDLLKLVSDNKKHKFDYKQVYESLTYGRNLDENTAEYLKLIKDAIMKIQ